MSWIELIKEYKEFIIAVLFFVCSLIFNIVVLKKKPTTNLLDTILKDVYEVLPQFINKVEVPGNGSTKKNTVLLLVQQYVFNKYGFRDFSAIEKQVSKHIEDELSTPHSHSN